MGLSSRIKRLEMMAFLNVDNPVVVTYESDAYCLYCEGHPMNGKTMTRAELNRFCSTTRKAPCILCFRPDSKAPRLETIREMMERLGENYIVEKYVETQKGVVRVLRTEEGKAIYDFGKGPTTERYKFANDDEPLSAELIGMLEEFNFD